MSRFKRAAIIFNPAANHGQAASLEPTIRGLFDDRIPYDLLITKARWHAEALARQAVATGADLIVAAGGDGTSHEVANGILAEGGDAALAVLATGSGNDYRRTLGMSKSLPRAVEEILAGRTKRVDVGVCNGVHFTNSLGVGLDGRVAHRAASMKQETGKTGIGLYLSSLYEILFKDYHGYRGQLSFDDGPCEEIEFLLLAVTNGFSYGGGFMITPQAVNGDGLLDWCCFDMVPLSDALWRIPFVVAGKHNSMKPVTTGRTRRVRLVAAEDVEAQLDGEPYTAREFDVTILPRVLTAVVGTGRVA